MLKMIKNPNNKYKYCKTLCLIGQSQNECKCNRSYFVGK